MRRLSFGLVSGVGALLLLLVAAQTRASVVEALDLAGLVRDADVIVLGEVVASQSHYDEHGRIVTDVEMVVESREKGDDADVGRSIVVRRLGGVVGGIGMRVEGEPSLTVGERTLLFAKRLRDAVTFRSVGLSQGVMRIEERAGERWVRSADAGAALVRRAGGGKLERAQVAVPEARRLRDLLSEVRALVAAQR